MNRLLVQIPRPVRFGLFYSAFYLGFGAYLPYMPVWYEERGLSPEMIGAAAAAAMAGRVIAAPLGAMLADRAVVKRPAILAYAIAAFMAFVAHLPASHPWMIVVLAGLAGGAFTGMIPIIDAFAISESTRRKFAFGPPRAWGSATFILGNVTAGALIGAWGGEAALMWTLSGAALTVLAAALLPEGRRGVAASSSQEVQGGRLKALMSNSMPIAFVASALIQGAHGFYYAFSAVAWRAEGISTGAVGWLWATGVAAEIVFFAVSARLLKSISPAMLLMLGGLVSILRWGVLALAPPLWALFALQGLHAFSFGASYLGFLRYAADATPERYGATAQAVNSALSGGLVLAGATYASGFAFSALGVTGFAVMMVPAFFGMVFAIALVHQRRTAP